MLPFVSRERYEEKCAELKELRQQHQALLNRMMGIRHDQVPPFNAEAALAEQIASGQPPLPVRRKFTVASISQWATQDAAKRASTPGVTSVTAELREAEARSRARIGQQRPVAPVRYEVEENVG